MAARQDEFYTKLSDIANELKYYREHFRGKVVLCNCDDPCSVHLGHTGLLLIVRGLIVVTTV